MIEVTLYSRSDCHLCDEAILDLEAIQEQIPHKLRVVDIDGEEALKKAYGSEVPVVEVGPYHLKAPFGRQELLMTLGAAQDRENHIQKLEDPLQDSSRPATWTAADRFSHWIANHYMTFFNLVVFIYVGLPFLAPVLMKAGAQAPAKMIYSAYGLVCHQLAFRSFFLFGEQPAYPRAAAGVSGMLTFNQATGLSEGGYDQDILAARRFLGNEQVGYKIGLCERDVAIYGAILLFGLIYAATGRRLPPLPWYLWILIGIVPIGLDGFSQLLSQPPLSLWAFRESTPFLRALTGALFGFTTAWFGYPLVEETMAETRRIMAAKLVRVRAAQGEGSR